MANTVLPLDYLANASPIIHSPNIFKIQHLDVHSSPPLFPNPNENPESAILEIFSSSVEGDDAFAEGEKNSTIHAMSE